MRQRTPHQRHGHMASWAKCPSYPKPPKGTTNFRNNNNIIYNSNKVKNNYSFAQAVTNAPRPQMAPENGSKTSTQNEARTKRNYRPTPNYAHNKQEGEFSHSIDLLLGLADILNKFPGLAAQLPRIAANKNNKNKKYAIIEALLDSESYV
ncbi:hypothetical protein NPIL_353221 [Nephila pilipes]|uniref:Uncharacterized protein n=1 Tax=Nephila pilipes TaxID=299642 RepID=A0A8X6QP35_NEPPI|nr:hypothetical protein NPIL_353221 [Nephila pilipes]